MCFPGIGTISLSYGESGGWVGIGVQPKLSTVTTGPVGLAPSHGRASATEAATPTNVQKLVIRWIAADGWMIIAVYFSPAISSSFRRRSEEFERAGRGESTETAESDVELVRIDVREHKTAVVGCPGSQLPPTSTAQSVPYLASRWSPVIGPVFAVGFGTLTAQHADPLSVDRYVLHITFCALRGQTTLYRARH